MLLGDALRLEDIRPELLLRLPGVHDEHREQEHPLVLALQLLQERLGILTVGGEVGRDDVHVVP